MFLSIALSFICSYVVSYVFVIRSRSNVIALHIYCHNDITLSHGALGRIINV